jgi:hypothetical protein
MAGLVPAIHGRASRKENVDGRHEAGHDGVGWLKSYRVSGGV